ncbi:MAG: rhomboid family intramembrane serine protease [Balneolales bacterium]|nr:rhomboid family intramembrane serine protease [Balneolales bacterium]
MYQPSGFTPAVKHLLIINGLFFVAFNTGVLRELLFFNFALFPFSSDLFRPWQLISYMFLHGGFGHIFFNMFALWIFGTAIEDAWGTKRFVQYYFIAGLGAAVIHMLITPSAVIGASGGVFGILLAFGMMFPERRIYMLLIPVGIKAKYFVVLYGALELMLGISSLQTGIAHFAHLGGMVVGFLLIKYWKLPTDLE